MTPQDKPVIASLTQRFARGVFWTLIGTAASRLFALATAVVTARLLGKAGFGELGMIQSTIGLLGTFAGFGLGLTTTKYVAELKEKDPGRAGRIIALSNAVALVTGGIMALVCVLASPWLAEKTINAPHLVPELRLGALLLFTSALLGVQTGTLSGFQAFKALARINFLQGLVSFPLALAMIYFWGLMGAMLSLISSSVVGVLFSSRVLAWECEAAGIMVDFRQAWTERRTLFDFSLPAVISGAMVSPVTWAGNAILVNQSNGFAELGLFNAANQFRLLIMFLPNILGMVMVPLLSEIHGQNDREFFARAVNLNLRTIWILALPCGFLVIGFSSWLMGLYGPQFHEGRAILALMVCVAIINLANGTVGQALIGSGRMWAGFFMNLGWAFIFMAAVSYFIPKKGSMGLALGYFLAYSLFTLWVFAYAAVKFGRESMQYSLLLSLLTTVVFLFSLGVGKVPEMVTMLLSLVFVIVSIFLGWRIMPVQGRQKIREIVGLKAMPTSF